MRVAVLDVQYRGDGARAAVVCAGALEAEQALEEQVVSIGRVRAYEPGAFYRRELPCLLEVLAALGVPPTLAVIDGYVWLDADGTAGLGAHLSLALEHLPVIGIAKTAYRGAAFAEQVRRGQSQAPLYVTAVGLDAKDAAACVLRMHGPHRVPTLARRADQLARGLVAPRR